MPIQYIIIQEKDAEQRLDRWLQQNYPQMPFSQIQKALRKGEIRIDSKRVKGATRLVTNAKLRLPPQFDAKAQQPKDTPFNITDRDRSFIRGLVIHEDHDIFVLNKPTGIATQGGSKITRHIDGLLPALTESYHNEQPRLVHRLDKATSGVLLIARHRDAATRIGKALQNKTIEKLYLAVIAEKPEQLSGIIKAPLLKKRISGEDRVVVDERNGQKAMTRYHVLDHASDKISLIALWPETGRQHQLRAHMAYLGTPIIGDMKYCDHHPDAALERRLHLHAYQVTLPANTTRHKSESLCIQAPLSQHMQFALDHYDFDLSKLTELTTCPLST